MLLSNGRGRGALVSVGVAVATLLLIEVELELGLCEEVLEGVVVVDSSSSFVSSFSSSSSFSALGCSPPGKVAWCQSLFTGGGGRVSRSTMPFASSSASSAAIERPWSLGGTRISGIVGGREARVRVNVRHSAKKTREARERGRYA
jgi:hypothetical protein